MGGRVKTKSTKKNFHVVIFINVEPSRQVLKLLLDLDECARGRQSYGWEDVNRGTEGIRRMLGGTTFGEGVTLRAVSCHPSLALPEMGRATP